MFKTAAVAALLSIVPALAFADGKLTKPQLKDAQNVVMNAYPAPFEKTYKEVVAKIGEPKKKGANMYQWYADDGGKCVSFYMTKDAKKGHAASGMMDADAKDCK